MSGNHQWILRLWRLVALGLAAWLLHSAAQKNEAPSRTSSISLDRARSFFPQATRVTASEQEKGGDGVFDQGGHLIGYLVETSPESDAIIGYAGPNNVLAALDPKGGIVGAELLSSGDTATHVAAIKKEDSFWKQFIGWAPAHQPMPKIEGVAGSTLTSLGIAEAVQKRLAGHVESLRFPEPVTLAEVHALFPSAETFQMEEGRPGWHAVKDNAGKQLGFAVRTSPFSDATHGHSGPTESLVAVTTDGKTVLGVRIRRSYDTDDYVDSVREDPDYLRQLTNFTVEQWAKMDFKKAGLEGVSGATETSFAVADSIHRRFAADAESQSKSVSTSKSLFKPRDWALLAILAGSLVMTFSSLRGHRRVRLAWQAILIGVFGLFLGDLLSVALFTGWSRNGLAWKIAPSLVLLAATALLVPWAFRRQLYCHELCPHGAAQEWLGRFRKLHVSLPKSVTKYLVLLPGVLLVAAFFLALMRPHVDLAALEPFDAWALRGAVVVSTVIALVGLVASLFVPMAYCRFGCPTGALLKFVRTTGSNDRFGLRDGIALSLIIAGSLSVFWPTRGGSMKVSENTTELHGTAFGTTWTVKIRNHATTTGELKQTLQAELERIESTLSHWRTNSATSRFNAANTTQPIEMPEELVTLVARTLEMSRASHGAFDITVGPLVQAWGFGPGRARTHAPEASEVARLRLSTGWEKLSADINTHTLQKSHPDLKIDLGAILQGYAADRLATLLNANKYDDYLIDVGGEFLARGNWKVAVENPAHPQDPLRVLQLRDAALATSGTYRANHTDGKKHWSHLINPHTGEPVEHETILVSVVHPSCASADAWATTLLVLGGERAEALANANSLSILM
ncbi:MAG: ApbE family lipoprotein, partial [Verrucomicrobiales bacterium]|nr:ApbE family lipoprotein [Verrucomicrobiales bacterium]